MYFIFQTLQGQQLLHPFLTTQVYRTRDLLAQAEFWQVQSNTTVPTSEYPSRPPPPPKPSPSISQTLQLHCFNSAPGARSSKTYKVLEVNMICFISNSNSIVYQFCSVHDSYVCFATVSIL